MHIRFAKAAFAVMTAAAALSIPGASFAQASDEVKEVYQRMADYLAQHEAFSVDMTLEYTIAIGEQSENLATTYSVAYQRPDDMSLEVESSSLNVEFYLDEDSITQYLPAENQYVVEQTDLEPAVLVSRAGIGPIPDAMVIFMELFLEKPFDLPTQFAVDSELKSEAVIDGELCDVVHIKVDKMSWDAWIAKGDSPVLRRIVPKLAAVEEYFAEQTKSHVEFQIVMDFDNWNFDAEQVRQELVFANADSAERLDSFDAAAPEGDPKEVLLGNPAPTFELTALDGSSFNLADHIGEEIIVLDFWATWCGPCRRAMPIIEKVTGEFADKDVALYAVNLEEQEPEIRKFLDEAVVDVNVLLDTDGSVQRAYLAHAIPQTVIIGKDGIVEAVHVGVAPDLEDVLRSELTALTEGRSLLSTD